MTRPSPDRLAYLRRVTDAATPGPWYAEDGGDGVGLSPNMHAGYPPKVEHLATLDDGEYVSNPNATADSEFIAEIRTGALELFAEIDALREEKALLEGSIRDLRSRLFAKRERFLATPEGAEPAREGEPGREEKCKQALAHLRALVDAQHVGKTYEEAFHLWRDARAFLAKMGK